MNNKKSSNAKISRILDRFRPIAGHGWTASDVASFWREEFRQNRTDDLPLTNGTIRNRLRADVESFGIQVLPMPAADGAYRFSFIEAPTEVPENDAVDNWDALFAEVREQRAILLRIERSLHGHR